MHVDTINQMDSLKQELTNNDGIERVIEVSGAQKATSNDMLQGNSANGRQMSMFGI